MKKLLEKLGLKVSLKKNLWYLDSHFILKTLCDKPAPVIFDIGACDGSSVNDFKKIFPDSSIYSFEPYPDSFKALEGTCNQYQSVKCYNLAISDKNGVIDFLVTKAKASNSILKAAKTDSWVDEHTAFEKKIGVDSITLDSFLEKSNIGAIDILKLDVQGAELLVLEGARESLKSKKIKFIYSEISFMKQYEEQPLYHDIATFLAQFGFLPFGIYNMHYRLQVKPDGHFMWGDAIFCQEK